jgi:predicted NodU family carbamoyl transferase
LLYGLADPTFPKEGLHPRFSDTGKLTALASFSKRNKPTKEEKQLLNFLLNGPYQNLSDYEGIAQAPHLNLGVEDPEFRNFVDHRIYSDMIFETFHRFARAKLVKGRPLLIAGGCGLNCDWNTKFAHRFQVSLAIDYF